MFAKVSLNIFMVKYKKKKVKLAKGQRVFCRPILPLTKFIRLGLSLS